MPTPPCGACRQVLVEFALGGDMDVVMATLAGQRKESRLAELLPESFISFEGEQ
jgi:cytidine deaminase